MIDTINKGEISQADRKDCLQRALFTLPFFYKMEFLVPTTPNLHPAPGTQVEARLGIGRDFFLTEVIADFGEAKNDIGSFFDLTLWTADYKSIYRFQAGKQLPSGFITGEARFRSIIANEHFVDRQNETTPFLIRQNDYVYGKITNTQVPINEGTINIILKGFVLLDQSNVMDSEVVLLQDSLNKPVCWDYFKIQVTTDPQDRNKRNYILENDKYPRLILGMGAINANVTKAQLPEITVDINDLSRRLQMTDTAIPLQFIAPRMTCLVDEHIYYLPTEYYFPPLGKLQFEIDNTWIDNAHPGGVEIAVLTRTP